MKWLKAIVGWIVKQRKKNKPISISLTSTGFNLLQRGEFDIFVSWDQISKITAYKTDEWTTDLVCHDLFLRNHPCQIVFVHEDMVGYEAFADTLANEFPGFYKDWRQVVILPPFERNETVLWDRKQSEE